MQAGRYGNARQNSHRSFSRWCSSTTGIRRRSATDLAAAVFIVLHISADFPSLLPQILARQSVLDIAHAIDGEPIKKGRIYVAPPDEHLIIEDKRVKLVHGPKENLHRPSIDALFRSAARWGGPRVIGVVLTGARYDGKVGMRAVKLRGGLTIVQDPTKPLSRACPGASCRRSRSIIHCRSARSRHY